MILFLAACKYHTEHKLIHIDLLFSPDGKISNLSQVALSVRYIPLETTENSVISRIAGFLSIDDKFYINTLDEILCFGSNGKFINKLQRRGRGPQEYQFISQFDISADNKYLALSGNKELLIYAIADSDYSFVKKLPVKVQPSLINFVNNNHLLLHYSSADGLSRYSQLLINFEGDTLQRRYNYFRFTSKDGWISATIYENLSYWFDNILFTKELQNDTVFKVDKSSFLTPYLVMDSEDKRITPEARSEGLYFSNHMNEYIQVQNIFESDSYFIFLTYYSDGENYYIYEKKTGKKFSFDYKKSLNDDFLGGPGLEPKYCRNGFLFSWVDAYKLKDYIKNADKSHGTVLSAEMLNLDSVINEGDNPVIILSRLK